MSYLVLARKWRPQTFEDVVGQQHVTRTLANAIKQDRVAHAFLFTGSRGVGKTSTARILAKALNCEHGPTPEPCNTCIACTEITSGRAVDVIEIDGASNRGINEIREVREAVRYAPSRDRYKVYIIDEVHMLTTEAFNALLKTLEEPPPHAVFVFATTEPNKIPVTILSRTQRYDFKRVQVRDIVKRLSTIAEAENLAFEPDALALIARQARGGMRDSLSAMDQVIAFAEGSITAQNTAEILGVAGREHLIRLGNALVTRDIDGALQILDFIDGYGHDLVHFSIELLHHLRDMTVVRATANARDITDLSDNEFEEVGRQVAAVPIGQLQRVFQLMADAVEQISRSQFPKLLLEMTLVKLAAVEPLLPLQPLLGRLEAIEKSLTNDAAMTDDVWEKYRAILRETTPPPVQVVVQGNTGTQARNRTPDTPKSATPASESKEEPAPAAAPPTLSPETSPALQAATPPAASKPEPMPKAQPVSAPEPVAAPEPAPAPEPAQVSPPTSQRLEPDDGPPSAWDLDDGSHMAPSASAPQTSPTGSAAPPAPAVEPSSPAVEPSAVPHASATDTPELEPATAVETPQALPPEDPIADPEARWVAMIQGLHATVGSILKHAVLIEWDHGVLDFWLPKQYLSLLPTEKRALVVARARQFDPDVEVHVREGDLPAEASRTSIADQRAEEHRLAKEEQRKQIRESPLLAAAMLKFGVSEEQVSIELQNDEELH